MKNVVNTTNRGVNKYRLHFRFHSLKIECIDTDNGATDLYGETCASFYTPNVQYDSTICGIQDDDDFSANTMCCVCKNAGIRFSSFDDNTWKMFATLKLSSFY